MINRSVATSDGGDTAESCLAMLDLLLKIVIGDDEELAAITQQLLDAPDQLGLSGGPYSLEELKAEVEAELAMQALASGGSVFASDEVRQSQYKLQYRLALLTVLGADTYSTLPIVRQEKKSRN